MNTHHRCLRGAPQVHGVLGSKVLLAAMTECCGPSLRQCKLRKSVSGQSSESIEQTFTKPPDDTPKRAWQPSSAAEEIAFVVKSMWRWTDRGFAPGYLFFATNPKE